MKIDIGTTVPYEGTKEQCFFYILEQCNNITKSIVFIELNSEHLQIRCPLSGDYLYIYSTLDELIWLHNMFIKYDWYKVTQRN